jgi:hypothetical protein
VTLGGAFAAPRNHERGNSLRSSALQRDLDAGEGIRWPESG